jgi:hypothetical protein
MKFAHFANNLHLGVQRDFKIFKKGAQKQGYFKVNLIICS